MLNPPNVTPKLTDRPVGERASSALDALGPIENQIASNPTTPGLHVPGAFPDPYPKSSVVQQDIQYVKDTAISALQTAKEYMPTSVEDVKRLIENTGDTVGGYLPQSVTAYLPRHTTADNPLACEPKSQNVRSATLSEGGTHPETSQNVNPESSGEAGILPDPPGEFGVAIPPDERISSQENRLNSETLHSETGIAVLPEERRQQNRFLNDDPPFITEKALPGDKEEVSVALLPEERKSLGASRDASTSLLRGIPSTKVEYRDISQDTLLATGSAPLPTISDENTTASSTYASHPIIPNTTARTYPLASDGFKFKGVPLSKGFQQELDQEQSSPTENSIDERRNLERGRSDVASAGHGAEAAAVASVGLTSHFEHETVRKKPGLMDKLKGEVKVISGKLSHKESMVEEGRRMMGRN